MIRHRVERANMPRAKNIRGIWLANLDVVGPSFILELG